MHTSLRISIGSANNQKKLSVSFGHVPHAVYIFALVYSSAKSTVFFCSL